MAIRVSIIGHSGAAGTKPKWRDSELQEFERRNLIEGVIEHGGTKLKVTENSGGANMSVDVAAGEALIEITNTNLTPSETYLVYFKNDGVADVSVTTADATNPRIDRLVAEVLVNADPDVSAANIGQLRLIAGTPAGSPAAPAEPSNCITLALISVPASDTTIANAQITDSRPYSSYKTNVMKDIMRQGMLNSHATATGTDTITAALDLPIAALVDKFTFFIVAANNNTGAVTVNLDGTGAKALKKIGTEALVANDLKAGVAYMLQYSLGDDNYKLISAVSNSPDGQEIGSVKNWPVKRAPANWLLCYGQAISRTTYSSLFGIICPTIGTFTVTIASPAVFSLTAHGFTEGDTLFFTTTGALPTGLTINTLYYVISAGLTADAFQVSATRGGSAVNTSGTQSGTHTVKECPYGLGDGTTTFNLPDTRGRVLVPPDNMGGSAASRITGANGKGLGGAAGVESFDISHTHSISHDRETGTGNGGGGHFDSSSSWSTGAMSANSTKTTLPPYVTMPVIIKYA